MEGSGREVKTTKRNSGKKEVVEKEKWKIRREEQKKKENRCGGVS